MQPGIVRAIVGLIAVGLPASVLAETVELTATADNTMYEGGDDVSNGAGDYFFAGETGSGSLRRALLAFDVDGQLPAGATISAVELRLYMSRTIVDGRDVSLHRVTSSWGEAGSAAGGQEGAGGPAESGDATWIYRFWNTTLWTNEGGDYTGAASATTSVADTGFYTWASTPEMVADVQAWLDDGTSDFGWVLVGDETQISAKRFNSRTSSNSSRRPRLTVTFELIAACCFEDGTCLDLTGDDCGSQGGTYQGAGTGCEPGTCTAPDGACCFEDGTCTTLTEANCLAQGGAYQSDGAPCSPNPCPQPTGACCVAAGLCEITTAAGCDAVAGIYQGDDTACVALQCPVALEPFIVPLPLPAVATPDPVDPNHYDIAIQRVEQSLHPAMTPITVYGYGGLYPGPTIEAVSGQPITVQWINDLRDDTGSLLTEHDLNVDTCAHGANDQSPRTVVHLHGGHVPAAVDGYPEFTFLPGASETYLYPNNQPAATLWYHDHALGITRLNVQMGMAGFYLVRDDLENALGLPSGEFEVPIVIQDRVFGFDGSKHRFVYPENWEEDFFGDSVLVNGAVWPFFEVKQGVYRFRLLNGANSRSFVLTLETGQPFVQIGSDGGLLASPVTLDEITLSPGERADVLVDFSGLAAGTEVRLVNSAPAPFPGEPGVGVIPDVMKFIVLDEAGEAYAPPGELAEVTPIPEAEARHERDFLLTKVNDACAGSRWLINGLGWDDITERPRLDTVEIWSFINRSGMVHPMHMHLVFFQAIDRQPFEFVGGEIVPIGDRIPVPPEEAGWKDTVRVMPFEITRVIARFTDYEGLFAYHCHILEHEDHEMMRQFETLPACSNDLDGDDEVAFGDLLLVLSNWGPCVDCPADLDGDGEVAFADLLLILSNWGPCPG